jgi:hypothetical protein
MLWEKDKVAWGRPNVTGTLLGIRRDARRRAPVDFRDQAGIYVLYDESRVPLWIGQAIGLYGRLQQHRSDHLWNRWTYFTWFGFRRVNANGTLGLPNRLNWAVHGTAANARDEIEAVLIQVLEPRLNRQGSRWGETTEYLQYVPRLHAEGADEQ